VPPGSFGVYRFLPDRSKEEKLRRTTALGLGLLLALAGMLQTSCANKGEERTFLKLYTSCNMMGSLEPCG
jgi:hypothetical protein